MLNLGWFSTGRDKAAQDLLQTTYTAICQGTIEATISFVFCSREPSETPASDAFMQLVESYQLPLICLSYKRFKERHATSNKIHQEFPLWRREYDRRIIQEIEPFNPDVCFLAGYMLIVGEELCSRYTMLNLHPSPPGGPAGSWQEVIWQLIAMRATKAGAMVHLVTPELDKGPAITFCTFPLRVAPFDKYWEELHNVPDSQVREHPKARELFHLIRQFELAREFPLATETLRAMASGIISIRDLKVAQRGYTPSFDLTQEVEAAITPGYRSHA